MFDVGFSEMLVIAIVALLVLGPERLPKAARFAGLWVRKARAQWYSVKAEFEREVASEEMQRSIKAPLAELQQAVQDSSRELESDLQAAKTTLELDLRIDPTPPATTTRVDSDTDKPVDPPAP
jgi:sec-independent protein translocase protein TatB